MFINLPDYSEMENPSKNLLNLHWINEEQIVWILSALMLASAFVTYFSFTTLNFRVSYGRYSSDSLLANIALPARLAWFLQEMPSFIIPLVAIWEAGVWNIPFTNLVILAMFIGHYFQRSFIYPLLIRGGKPTPIHLFLLGVIFCSWNGYIQGHYHVKYANYPPGHLRHYTSIIGIMVYSLGMYINISSDSILRNLRTPGERGYKIPHGGAFEFVSGANFFGEIVEWLGYALLAQSTTAWAFSLFTMGNTIPRAIQHHKWYLEHFKDYPKNRRAVIPYLL